MLGFGKHAQLPQFFVKLFHKRLNAGFDNAEIMVLKLLPFRRHCAEQRTAGKTSNRGVYRTYLYLPKSIPAPAQPL